MCNPPRAPYDAAKKLYDSRVALQKQGALAQRQVDETQLQMVQAQTQLDTAQQHLKSLNGVGRQEAIRAAQAQMNAAKAHAETSAVQLSYARIVSPINGVVADRVRLSGRDGERRHAHDFHRRYFPGSRGRECAGERSRVHQGWPAGSRRWARGRYSRHGDRGQSGGQRQCHHGGSLGRRSRIQASG